MKKATASLAFAVIGMLALPALADDIQPPSWRGEWSTTSQIWEFDDPALPGWPILPDGPAPGGNDPLPSTHVVISLFEDYIETDPSGSGRYGIWPLSGYIDVVVDNHQPPNEFKWVWVQLTWSELEPGSGAEPFLFNLWPAPLLGDGPRIVATEDLGFGWYETTYEWFLRPNPPDEYFTIGGDIYVDELVIDTWCIPEPATLSLLALGGLALLRKKRK